MKIDRTALGPATIGARLVCSGTVEAPTIEYAWLRNGAPIPGATSASYVTTAADEGKAVQCQATFLTANTGATQAANPVYVAPPALGTAPGRPHPS